MQALVMCVLPAIAFAQAKVERAITAVVTDNQGVETEIKNAVFYWEEKLSETSFVPHELRHLPVKRGSTLNNIPFDRIKQVEIRSAGTESIGVIVTLSNGKSGEFVLTTPGSFRGESDFGQADVPVKAVSKVVFK
jgi:hypothetical protein